MTTTELLNREDYFQCEKLACIMPRHVCIMRQEQAMSFKEFVSGKKASPKRINYAMCADCNQGRNIKGSSPTLHRHKQFIPPARKRTATSATINK